MISLVLVLLCFAPCLRISLMFFRQTGFKSDITIAPSLPSLALSLPSFELVVCVMALSHPEKVVTEILMLFVILLMFLVLLRTWYPCVRLLTLGHQQLVTAYWIVFTQAHDLIRLLLQKRNFRFVCTHLSERQTGLTCVWGSMLLMWFQICAKGY